MKDSVSRESLKWMQFSCFNYLQFPYTVNLTVILPQKGVHSGTAGNGHSGSAAAAKPEAGPAAPGEAPHVTEAEAEEVGRGSEATGASPGGLREVRVS